jgi:hypothetical protein
LTAPALAVTRLPLVTLAPSLLLFGIALVNLSTIATTNGAGNARKGRNKMYTTREEIKAELLENAEQIRDNGDNLAEWVDGFCSPYYSDTLKDWVDMDDEYRDRWKEFGYDANRNDGGILQLMAVDVWFYYDELTRQVWAEIEEEREAEDND